MGIGKQLDSIIQMTGIEEAERRVIDFQIKPAHRSAGSPQNYIVEGYAALFEPYILYYNSAGTPIYELFTRDSFRNTVMNDVVMLYNHTGKVYARQTNGTLRLSLDDRGIKIWADLSTSESTREFHQEIAAGLVTKMSWSFRTGEYVFDKDRDMIIHKSIPHIYDVSAVSIPANDSTSIMATDPASKLREKKRLCNEIAKELLLGDIGASLYKRPIVNEPARKKLLQDINCELGGN